MIVTRNEDGTFSAENPFIVTCGCGSVVPSAKRLASRAGLTNIPMIVSSSNPIVKGYLKQIGLDEVVTSLKKNKHAVLYNPRTHKYVDMLGVPESDEIIKNLYEVAYGRSI